MRERCAVEDCIVEGKPHPCPYDGAYHRHGRIHYTSAADVAGLTFRKGWFLICDFHYDVLLTAHNAQRRAG